MTALSIHNKSLVALLCGLLACLTQACVVQRIDHTPYQQTDYYRHTLAAIDQTSPEITSGTDWQIGWAKVNITPPVGSPLAGYGKRKGLRYTEVHDSVWVRSFVFDNGEAEAVVVALDMLIAPMTVTAALEKEYEALGLKPEQVYLTATHTHSSFGGWGQKLVGWLMAGKKDKKLVRQTTDRIVQSITSARQQKQPARLGYGTAYAPHLVRNRLTGAQAGRDTTIRFIRMEQHTGETAVLVTFAAHPTILPSMAPELSRDYPGELVDRLEQSVSFAAFAAGAVGSQGIVSPHGDTYASTAAVGQQVAAAVLENLHTVQWADTARIGFARYSLGLPKPQWRLNATHRFAPFLFHRLFGKYPSHVNTLQLGHTLLLGVPADFSGELLPPLERQAVAQGQQVMVTGFNGGYIGYITPDQHYQLEKYETRSMNFYGPHSGNYLTEVMLYLIRQHQKR